jgi:transposase
MIGKKKSLQPTLFVPGNIRDFIPDDHILVKVNKILKLDWLEDAVSDKYCKTNGRPSIAPEVALRLMLAGFFLGIVHDRKLMRETQVNMAIRWFAGFNLTDTIPNHSSLSKIRSRWGEELFTTLFEKIAKQCIDAGLVSGETVHIDATLIRADVSWESLSRNHAQNVIDENKVEEDSEDKNNDDSKPERRGRPAIKQKLPKKKSSTDPDASLSTNCRTKAMIPCFKQHTAVDDKEGIVVDIDVQTGDDSEGKRLPEVVQRVEKITERRLENLTADSGYAYGENYKFLEERKTNAIIPPQKSGRRKNEKMPLSRFKFNELKNHFICPAGKKLNQKSVKENKTLYKAKISDCKNCKLRSRCFGESGKCRTISITNGYTSLLRARRKKDQGWGKAECKLYGRHRYQVEGIHGEAKSCHGFSRAMRRGRVQVLVQALMTAAVINLKRLAKFAEGQNSSRKTYAASILKQLWAILKEIFVRCEFKQISKQIFPISKKNGNRNIFPAAA